MYEVKIVSNSLTGKKEETELSHTLETLLAKVDINDVKTLLQKASQKPSLIKTALKFI